MPRGETGDGRQWRPEIVRARIRASQLIKRLYGCAMGEIEMTANQINSARILLGKVVPDLKAIEHSGTVGVNYDAAVVALLNGADVEYASTVEAGDPAGAGSLPH